MTITPYEDIGARPFPSKPHEIEREIIDLLAHGNACSRRLHSEVHTPEPLLDRALACCNRIDELLRRIPTSAETSRVRALTSLLRANIQAQRPVSLMAMTPGVRAAYETAILLASASKSPEALGRAYRAYGAVLAYHCQWQEAEAELAAACRQIDSDSDSAMWAMTACTLARVKLALGKPNEAIDVLLEACARFGYAHAKTREILSEHIAAATLLVCILWQANRSRDMVVWLERLKTTAPALQARNPGKDLPECDKALELVKANWGARGRFCRKYLRRHNLEL